MITSAKGQRMLESISPIYEQSLIMQAVLEAAGLEWDDAEALSDDILRQLFPQTATWGIVYWEALLKIRSNKANLIEQRRARVLAKMQTRWPITKERMEQIVKTYSHDADIKEIFIEYTFKVFFYIGQEVNLKTLCDIISETKPAHLDYALVMSLRQKEGKVFVGSAMVCGEEITVYPWSPKKLSSRGKVYVAAGNNTGLDTTTVYPKGSD